MEIRWVLRAGEGRKLLDDSLVSGPDENPSFKESSGKPNKRTDGQYDLSKVKSIKVHQIQSSCFLRVTNICWKLRKMKGEKCLRPLEDWLFLCQESQAWAKMHYDEL